MYLKPGFFSYIKSQLSDYYNVTGIVEDKKIKCTYIEKHFFMSKCIIDLFILVSSISFIFNAYLLISQIYIPIYEQLYNSSEYNPNLGIEVMLIKFLLYTSMPLIIFIIAPLFVKVLRLLIGIRWIFIKFEKYSESGEKSNDSKRIKYLEFYNNYIAIQVDKFFYKESRKRKSIKTGYYKNGSYSMERNCFVSLYHLTLIILFICSAIIGSGITTIFNINLILYLSVLLYGLSHIYAYIFWKKHKPQDVNDP